MVSNLKFYFGLGMQMGKMMHISCPDWLPLRGRGWREWARTACRIHPALPSLQNLLCDWLTEEESREVFVALSYSFDKL